MLSTDELITPHAMLTEQMVAPIMNALTEDVAQSVRISIRELENDGLNNKRCQKYLQTSTLSIMGDVIKNVMA